MENKKREIAKFYTKIFSDPVVKSELTEKAKKIKDKEDLKNFIKTEIVPLAKENGFNFLDEDLFNYESETLKKLKAEDLYNVSGGISFKSALMSGGILSALFLGAGFTTLQTADAVLTPQQVKDSGAAMEKAVNEFQNDHRQPVYQTNSPSISNSTQSTDDDDDDNDNVNSNENINNDIGIDNDNNDDVFNDSDNSNNNQVETNLPAQTIFDSINLLLKIMNESEIDESTLSEILEVFNFPNTYIDVLSGFHNDIRFFNGRLERMSLRGSRRDWNKDEGRGIVNFLVSIAPSSPGIFNITGGSNEQNPLTKNCNPIPELLAKMCGCLFYYRSLDDEGKLEMMEELANLQKLIEDYKSFKQNYDKFDWLKKNYPFLLDKDNLPDKEEDLPQDINKRTFKDQLKKVNKDITNKIRDSLSDSNKGLGWDNFKDLYKNLLSKYGREDAVTRAGEGLFNQAKEFCKNRLDLDIEQYINDNNIGDKYAFAVTVPYVLYNGIYATANQEETGNKELDLANEKFLPIHAAERMLMVYCYHSFSSNEDIAKFYSALAAYFKYVKNNISGNDDNNNLFTPKKYSHSPLSAFTVLLPSEYPAPKNTNSNEPDDDNSNDASNVDLFAFSLVARDIINGSPDYFEKFKFINKLLEKFETVPSCPYESIPVRYRYAHYLIKDGEKNEIFLSDEKNKSSTIKNYSNCVETALRHTINLLSYDEKNKDNPFEFILENLSAEEKEDLDKKSEILRACLTNPGTKIKDMSAKDKIRTAFYLQLQNGINSDNEFANDLLSLSFSNMNIDEECPYNDIIYKKNNNEIRSTGCLNLLKVLYNWIYILKHEDPNQKTNLDNAKTAIDHLENICSNSRSSEEEGIAAVKDAAEKTFLLFCPENKINVDLINLKDNSFYFNGKDCCGQIKITINDKLSFVILIKEGHSELEFNPNNLTKLDNEKDKELVSFLIEDPFMKRFTFEYRDKLGFSFNINEETATNENTEDEENKIIKVDDSFFDEVPLSFWFAEGISLDKVPKDVAESQTFKNSRALRSFASLQNADQDEGSVCDALSIGGCSQTDIKVRENKTEQDLKFYIYQNYVIGSKEAMRCFLGLGSRDRQFIISEFGSLYEWAIESSTIAKDSNGIEYYIEPVSKGKDYGVLIVPLPGAQKINIWNIPAFVTTPDSKKHKVCGNIPGYQIDVRKLTMDEGIEKFTFWDGAFKNTGIEEIDLSKSKLKILIFGVCSFDSCKKFKSLILPETIQKLNVRIGAFSGSAVEKVELDKLPNLESVKIENSGFSNCKCLRNFTLPTNLKALTLENFAFYRCGKLAPNIFVSQTVDLKAGKNLGVKIIITTKDGKETIYDEKDEEIEDDDLYD